MSSATIFRRLNKSVAATLFVVCAALIAQPKSIPTATPAPSPAASPAGSTIDSPTTTTPAPVKGRVVLPPEKSQPVNIGRFEKAPVIDGRLDDAAWQSAATFKNFYQTSPGDNTEPSKPTEVMMGYDSKTLYIAFHCFDEPDKVSASIAKRDDVLNGVEDSIRVLLDTFNDQRKAYVLAFNPLGVQMDGIRTEGVNVDFSVDIVMESKGTITNTAMLSRSPFRSSRCAMKPAKESFGASRSFASFSA